MNKNKKCLYCGQSNFNDAKYCEKCGHILNDSFVQQNKNPFKKTLSIISVIFFIAFAGSILYRFLDKSSSIEESSGISRDEIVVSESRYQKQPDGYYLQLYDEDNYSSEYKLDDEERLVEFSSKIENSYKKKTEISYDDDSVHTFTSSSLKDNDGKTTNYKYDNTYQLSYDKDNLLEVSYDKLLDMDSDSGDIRIKGKTKYEYDSKNRLKTIYQVSRGEEDEIKTTIKFYYFKKNDADIVVEINQTESITSTGSKESQLVSVYFKEDQNKDLLALLEEHEIGDRKTLHRISEGLYTDYVDEECFTGSQRYIYQSYEDNFSSEYFGKTHASDEMKYYYNEERQLIFVEGSKNGTFIGGEPDQKEQSVQIINIGNEEIAIIEENTIDIKNYIEGKNKLSESERQIELENDKDYAEIQTLWLEDDNLIEKHMILDKQDEFYKELKNIESELKDYTDEIIDRAIEIKYDEKFSADNDIVNEMINQINNNPKISSDSNTRSDQIPIDQIPGDNFAGLETGQYILQYDMNTRVSPDYNAEVVGKLVKGVPIQVVDMVEGENGSVWGKLIHGNWICLRDDDYEYAIKQ